MPEDYHLFDSHQKRCFWENYVKQWQQSGLSQSAYCREYALKAHRFYYWKQRILKPQADVCRYLFEKLYTCPETEF